MEHLLTAWPRVARMLGGARHILLLSDYDGTLTPIVERPELATLPAHTRSLLKALSQQRRMTVGIVSGRALSDLKKRVGLEGLVYAGNHGLEIDGPHLNFVSPVAEELRPVLNVMHYVLLRALGTVKGVLVENKGLTLTVHYRMADARNTADVENIVKKVVGPAAAGGKARLTSGKKVYEVRPAVDWNKGKAIKLLMKRYGKGGRQSRLVPIYLGDDSTDEDGFKVIEAYGNGISVFVGEPDHPTAARYVLRSPEEVGEFLSTLLGDTGEFCAKPLPGKKAIIQPYEPEVEAAADD